MARLQVIAGPKVGQSFELPPGRTLIGRELNVDVRLDSPDISREHAAITRRGEGFFLEDLGSLNKTVFNGQAILPRQPVKLHDNDRFKVGPVVLQLRLEDDLGPEDLPQHVSETISAKPGNLELYSANPARKLEVVLDIARHLATTLDLDLLLGRLLDHLFHLFPQADRGLALLLEVDGPGRPDGGRSQLTFRVRAQQVRQAGAAQDYPYSRSLVTRALESGEGLLSDNFLQSPNVPMTESLRALELRSFLCVPLLGSAGQRLGVLQLDALRGGGVFTRGDLDLLATVALQVSTVVEKAAMHAELVRRARTDQELEAAGEVQMSLLPQDFDDLETGRGVELFARVLPARCVAGDLYDVFPLPDGRLAFLVGDVSGKGMPAALYMVAVRTLTRQLVQQASGPADLIVRLHRALLADTATDQFVTLVHGVYDPAGHAVTFAVAGHPPPLLRRADGAISTVSVPPAAMAGSALMAPKPVDTTVLLAPGDTFIAYTDGCYEPFGPGRTEQFGMGRLMEVLSGPRTRLPLRQCFDEAAAALCRFAGSPDRQDDATLLLLRKTPD